MRFFVIALLLVVGIYQVHIAESHILSHMQAEEDSFDQQMSLSVAEEEAMLADQIKARTGSVFSKEVAAACMSGDDPYLLAAVAIKEGANPYRYGADGEYGAWQVMAKHWGRVPADAHGQALQAQRVLRWLLIEHDGIMFLSICRYNGAGEDAIRYARDVFRIYAEITTEKSAPAGGAGAKRSGYARR